MAARTPHPHGSKPWRTRPARFAFITLALCLAKPLVTSATEFEPSIVLESPNASGEGWFGAGSVSAVPDVNGDGKADILVCAVNEFGNTQNFQTAGRVYLFDGVTRELLRELRSPNENSNSRFGSEAAGIDDVNGDGSGDVIVATGSGENRVYVLDGATGEPIHTFPLRGVSLSSVPDVNGDGRPDIVIGNNRQGIARIYDGASGALHKALSGGGFFGWAVSGIPDVNGDGAGDVIVGAWRANQAFIHDGATGERLHTLTGSAQFGRSVAGLGDVNGDGRGDVVVGAQESNRADIYDGATGTLLHTLSVPGNPFRFGWVVNRLPDVDGDGRDDVVVAGFQDYDQSRIPADAFVFSGATGELLATLPGHSDYGSGRSIAGLPDVAGDGLAELLIANPLGDSSTGVSQAGQVSLYLSDGGGEIDSDGDGLPDSWEEEFFGSLDELAAGDPDGDTLTNEHELAKGSDPTKPDTDDDGLSDSVETNTRVFVDATDTGTDPTLPDTDDDGLLDGVETNTGVFISSEDTGTDPNDPHTDKDLFDDGQEVLNGTDPLDLNDPPRAKIRGALSLDGVSYVTFQNPTGLIPEGNEPFTIEAWINPTTIPRGGEQGGQITFWGTGATDTSNGLRLRGGAGVRHSFWGSHHDESFAEGSVLSDSTGPRGDGWHHVAFTYDGSETRWFHNGNPIGTPQEKSNVNVSNANHQIGRLLNLDDHFYHGFIDELGIWNVALSPEDILEGHDKPLEPTAEGIVALWDFDGDFTDLTGNGHHGTPVGAGATIDVSKSAPIAKANQIINVEAPPTVAFDASPLGTIAESSAGLPVDFSLLSGPARWVDDKLIATGVGTIRLQASQAGDENVEPAEEVLIEIEILPPEEQMVAGIENEPVLIPVLGEVTAGFEHAFPEETPYGMIEQTEQGWTYRSDSGFSGDDSFSYTLVDTETETETEVAVTVSIERTTGTLVVQISLPDGGWRVAGEDTFRSGAGAEAVFLPAGDHQLEFLEVSGYMTPEPLLVTLETGEEKTLEIDYPARDPYQEWLVENFTPEQLDDAAVSGREADIDRDGFPTEAEWALRLDPFLADVLTVSREAAEGFAPHIQVVGEGEEQKLLLTFLRRTDHEALGLDYGAEFSIDLIEWSAGVLEAVVPVDEDWEQVTIASSVENGEVPNLHSLFVHFGVMSSPIDDE